MRQRASVTIPHFFSRSRGKASFSAYSAALRSPPLNLDRGMCFAQAGEGSALRISLEKRSERLITVERSLDMLRRKIENVAQADSRITNPLRSILCLGAHTCSLVLMLLAIASFDPVAAQEFPADTTRGKAVYERHCLACHGTGGYGNGPEAAALRVSPTDFHRFSSYLKSDEDLLRTIEQGVIFSPMHSWQGRLSETARHDVLAYIRLLVQQGR